MNHYCTYFDRSFLIQGMALATSLRMHDASSVLWVLCLDETTKAVIDSVGDAQLRPVALSELEAADPELLAVKPKRSRVEYYFTLSPCWPIYLFHTRPEIDRMTYLDADLFLFADPSPIFAEMDAASVLVTEHRHPPHLAHHRRCGRFNVGILSFRNNDTGRACLEWWRDRCLEWCYDRVEEDKYADQKYLDHWPLRYGGQLCVLSRRGVNLAPWNWSQYRFSIREKELFVDEDPLEVFHFARFRPTRGTWWFQSGQLEYGVMPWSLRQHIYGRYWQALKAAQARIAPYYPEVDFPPRTARGWHGFWRVFIPRLLFGSDWLQIGGMFISGRGGLGRFSGRFLSWLRGEVFQRGRRLITSAVPRREEPVFAEPPHRGK